MRGETKGTMNVSHGVEHRRLVLASTSVFESGGLIIKDDTDESMTAAINGRIVMQATPCPSGRFNYWDITYCPQYFAVGLPGA